MTPLFSIRTTPHFDRLAKALTRRQPDFAGLYDRAREILGTDPTNRTAAPILKSSRALHLAPASGGSRSAAFGSASTSTIAWWPSLTAASAARIPTAVERTLGAPPGPFSKRKARDGFVSDPGWRLTDPASSARTARGT